MIPTTAQEIIQRRRWHLESYGQACERAIAPLIQQIYWLITISMLQSLEPEYWDDL